MTALETPGRAAPRLPAAAWDWAALSLAAITLFAALAIALARLDAGPWMDEFNTIVTTLQGFSIRDYLDRALRGQHPALYEGLVYLAQNAGLTSIAALRLLNLLGAPIVLATAWSAWRCGAVSPAQVAIVVALYASSANFVNYAPAVRPYFLMYSASIAAALAWRTLARDGAAKRALIFWGLSLFVFANVHYFATILGGLMTIAALVAPLRTRRWRDATRIAGVSLLAAAPALLMGLAQAGYTTTAGVLYYYPAGLAFALKTAQAAIAAAFAANWPAALLALALPVLPRLRRAPSSAAADGWALWAIALSFFALVIALHLIKPMIWERYLMAAAGAILVGAALLAGDSRGPRWVAPLVCLYALFALFATAKASPPAAGWSISAAEVARRAQTCRDTRVLAVPYARVSNGPVWSTPLNPTEIEARNYGYRYYARRYGFSFTELKPRDRVAPPSGPCPTLIWIEHFWAGEPTAQALLRNLEIDGPPSAVYERIGSGVIVTAPPAR
ncbi:MAG: hypothetical protein AB7M12_03740 [Hyphomonadaceae bacterium]